MTDGPPEKIWAFLTKDSDDPGHKFGSCWTRKRDGYAEYVRVVPAEDDAGDDARIAAASRREWAERAWRAESERDRLREALRQCPPTSNPTVSEEEHLRRINAWWSLTARAALKGEAP